MELHRHESWYVRSLYCHKRLHVVSLVHMCHAHYAMLAKLSTGLNVVEVAHDIQAQVSKYVKSDLKLTNSYDTWHGNAICSIVMHILTNSLTTRNEECEEGNGEDHQGSG